MQKTWIIIFKGGCGSGVEPVSGGWFDSPGLHAEVSLGKILNPKTAPDVLVGV